MNKEVGAGGRFYIFLDSAVGVAFILLANIENCQLRYYAQNEVNLDQWRPGYFWQGWSATCSASFTEN